MIKLVAADLDGTLLNEKKELPEEIFGIIENLSRLGILFAAASGRQYANLCKLFAPVRDKILFLCENGALVKYREKTLFFNPIPQKLARKALEKVRSLGEADAVLCGQTTAYIESGGESFWDEVRNSYDSRAVRPFEEVVSRESLCKIAVYSSSAERCMQELESLLPELFVMISGEKWCDISAPDANKGEAMRFLRKTFCLRREECAGFGDHMNDLGLLCECQRAYVPENAYPPLKERFEVVPSNDRGGVLLKLKEILSSGGNL